MMPRYERNGDSNFSNFINIYIKKQEHTNTFYRAITLLVKNYFILKESAHSDERTQLPFSP